VKAYANSKGVKLLGDMPIYVGGHSADVWSNRQLWTLDERGLSAAVSGVPPDAFSDDGQLWGSPLYDWAAHEKVRHLRERDRETEREKVGMHAERQRERERERLDACREAERQGCWEAFCGTGAVPVSDIWPM
jgi:hypothetical protein